MSKRIQKNKKSEGFTLVELIVATGLFIFIIALVSGIFTQSIRTQRMLAALMEVQSNAGLSVEKMMREVRTGFTFRASSVSGSSCDSVGLYDSLTFTRSVRNATTSVTYSWVGTSIERDEVSDGTMTTSTLNAPSVSVNRLCFMLNNNPPATPTVSTLTPWRVTFFINLGPSDPRMSSRTIDIETTVSARTLPSEI